MLEDDGDKGRRGPACFARWRFWLAHAARGAVTCYRDYIPILPILLGKAIVYAYATQELLQPADVTVVQVASVIYHIVFFLTLASWVGVIYHGPGRMPTCSQGQASEFPAAVAAALSAGRFCSAKPFDARDKWCKACNCWQPAMAEHCSICRRCCMWRDRHCLYAVRCIGFRNLRCFFIWLMYVRAQSIICMALIPLRLFAGTSVDIWLGLRLFGFFVIVGTAGSRSRKQTGKLSARLSDGWPCQPLLAKFEGVLAHAEELSESMAAGLESWTTIRDCEEMTAAIQKVRKQGGRLRGLFGGKEKLLGLTFVMGAAQSWRWLLPFVPGGSGDPLRPTVYDAAACEAWTALAECIDRFRNSYLRWSSAEEAKLAALIAVAERATASDQSLSDAAS